jgi:hypothetical protein
VCLSVDVLCIIQSYYNNLLGVGSIGNLSNNRSELSRGNLYPFAIAAAELDACLPGTAMT